MLKKVAYRRTLETAASIADRLDLPVTVEAGVRERAFFTCDVGSASSRLARDFPRFDFSHLAETWWPPLDEDEDQLANRCEHFRRQAADWHDWADLLVVTHWGFIRDLTGEAVPNGTLLRFDPVHSRILQS